MDRIGNETVEGVNWRSGISIWMSGLIKWKSGQRSPTSWEKGSILRNPPNVNYSDKRTTWRSMGWNNLIFWSNELHSVSKSYVNVVNAIYYFVKPTPPTNIITNETILTQCIIKQGLKVFVNKGEATVQKEIQQFHSYRVLNLINPKTLVMNSREGLWNI